MAMSHKGLAKLAEELGELSQVVGKKLAYMEGPHPDGGVSLDLRLEEEMGDVIAAISFVQKKLKLESAHIQLRAHHKLDLFQNWDKQP